MLADNDYYEIDEVKGLIYAATYLLVQMDQHDLQISSRTYGPDRQLMDAIALLLEKNYISEKKEQYQLLPLGKEKVIEFQQRLSNILTYIDIFGYIDLDKGEFAFQKFGTFASDEGWNNYLDGNRWSDLRIAMIDYLDGDATELVFSQLIQENQLSTEEISWRNNLTTGEWWKQIQDICDNAIQEEDLGYQDGNKKVSGSDVLDDIYDQGVALLQTFFPHDLELQNNLKAWYNEPTQNTGYGSPMMIKANSRPPWETPWKV